MGFHDLRGFLARLESTGQLRRIAETVDPVLESTAFCLRVQRAQGPALLFEKAGDSAHTLLGNLFGHRTRIEAALAGRPMSSLRELGELLAAIKEPRWPGSLREALAAWPEFAQLAHVAPRRVREAAFTEQAAYAQQAAFGQSAEMTGVRVDPEFSTHTEPPPPAWAEEAAWQVDAARRGTQR